MILKIENFNPNVLSNQSSKVKLQAKRNCPQIGYAYSISEGNNGDLVKRVMKTRNKCWSEGTGPLVNLKWTQSIYGYDFSLNKQFQKLDYERIFNHFEFHSELSDKSLLLTNLMDYGKKNSVNVSAFLPLT